MSDDIKKALVEVDLIIEQVIPKEQTLKIPKKFKDFIKNNKDPNYLFKYNFEKELEEQVLMNDTKILLGMLYLNYWATDDEKKEINHILDENEKKYIEQISEKYSTNNIFKKQEKKYGEEMAEINLPVKHKEGMIKKIIKFIKSIFKRSDQFEI